MADEETKNAENIDEQAQTPDAPETPAADAVQDNQTGEPQDAENNVDAAEQTPQADTTEANETPELPDFSHLVADAAESSIELLNDVEMDVKIELGRADLAVEDILKLSEGSVVELNKLAGDAVDILVNEKLIARGEVLVVNDNFCVRINEIIPGVSERVNM